MDTNDDLLETTDLFDKLKPACGDAPDKLLVCDGCDDPATKYKPYNRYSWCMKLTCTQCNQAWFICKECPTLRKRLTNQAMLSHHVAQHSKKRKATLIENQSLDTTRPSAEDNEMVDDDKSGSDDDDGMYNNSDPMDDKDSKLLSEEVDLSSIQLNFQREESQKYFEHHLQGRGTEALVCQALFHHFDPNSTLDEEQQSMHIQIATLVSRISCGERDILAKVLQKVEAHAKRTALDVVNRAALESANRRLSAEGPHGDQSPPYSESKQPYSHSKKPYGKSNTPYGESNMPYGKKKIQNTLQTHIPTTSQMIHSIYVKGKHALLPNLPHPMVTLINNHAYVPLKDCISDFLANGHDIVL